MGVAVGSKVPDVTVKVMRDGKPEAVQTADVLGTGKVVLFAVPGAFTPGCSKIHLPGYVEHGAELKAKGIARSRASPSTTRGSWTRGASRRASVTTS